MQKRVVIIDNMDSFTENVGHLFQRAGGNVTIVRCDRTILKDIEDTHPGLLVISPGPGTPEEATLSRSVVRHFSGKIPVFGICLGMQCIVLELGGVVSKGDPCHGKMCAIHHTRTGIFSGLPSPLTVGRYHSLHVSGLPGSLELTAWTSERIPMAVRHPDYALAGVQFHPESFLTEAGISMAENVLNGNF